MDRYVLDTTVYVRALRDKELLTRLKQFLMRAGTRLHMSAVVALELRAGASTSAQEAAVAALLEPYVTRGRVVVPSFQAFAQAGRVLSALVRTKRYSASASPPALANDALLAASCREAAAVLVTENHADFAALQRHLRGFRFAGSELVFG